jgi:hypothetical protein
MMLPSPITTNPAVRIFFRKSNKAKPVIDTINNKPFGYCIEVEPKRKKPGGLVALEQAKGSFKKSLQGI